MGLEKVIKRIEKQGDENIKTMLADAEQQAEQILDKMRKTTDEISNRRKQEFEKQLEYVRVQEQSSLELETKRILLNAQKEILEKTYDECLQALHTVPHEQILSSLLKKVKQELPEAVYISSNKRDEPLIRNLSNFKFTETIDCIGGIVVENADKTMKLDFRYETIAATVWEQHLKEIADTLFR